MKIKTILIDDEAKSISILENKLQRFCPTIEIIATSQEPDNAIELINNLQPDLIFLDISMPGMTGFELLNKIEKASFEVIFATAYDHYAIEAIKNNASGYILKPYDNDDLVKMVHITSEKIALKLASQNNKNLLDKMSIVDFKDQKVLIPNREGIDFVKMSRIIHCEGVDGYTRIHLKNGKNILSSQSIGNFVKILSSKHFFQTHKSHIINLDYVVQYLNEGYISLETGTKIPLSKAKKDSFFEMIQHRKIGG